MNVKTAREVAELTCSRLSDMSDKFVNIKSRMNIKLTAELTVNRVFDNNIYNKAAVINNGIKLV